MLRLIVLSTTVLYLVVPVIFAGSCRYCNENKKGCGPDYCDDKNICILIMKLCNDTQVQIKWPEQCICCPNTVCLDVVSEGEPCGGDPIYAVCANGLKCCSNVCRKVD
ncbi:uncharacterized protein LOC114330562 isoform X2 [Diabrotica virgifera virgifera]|uniref:Uncharacterized protein n=1 Tax=Diabrotica virgifera virgifera TaxID=50390 RepID=A0ABM5ILJ7_DIAVI|nr:uncharacterized protein LOC114330562 isoform X2 [Diabrotica virgifera virgifera]